MTKSTILSAALQNMQTGGTPPPIERKKDELESYMEQAAALMKQYVPPNPGQMEAAFQAGNATLGEAGPGTADLRFRNYVKPGDSLVLTFNISQYQ